MALDFNIVNQLAFDIQTINGSSTSRGAQAFAFDERTKYLYVMEGGAVNRYNIADAPNVSAFDQSAVNGAAIGHQGLAIEYLQPSGIKLWSTSSTVGRAAVRMDYKNNGPIDTGEVYTLFPTGTFANSTSCTPTISHDQKYLIAHGAKVTGSVSTVRVFELAKILALGPGDRSEDYLYEWTTSGLTDANNPLQGTASDGSYVYLVAGGTGFTETVNKRLHVYKLDGTFIEANNDTTVGREDALATPDGTRYEPEGLSMMADADGRLWLYIGILSGNPGARRFRIYRLRAYRPITQENLGMVSSFQDFNDKVADLIGLPDNTMHEVLLVDSNGKFGTRPSCIRTSIVENDVELNLMKGAKEDFGKIFNYWKRISRSGTTWSDESNPAELTGWAYNATTDQLSCTINSGTLIGFMSPDKFDNYVFDVQVSSDNNDDDFIGLCIAYAVDPADGKTHILTAMRGMNGRAPLTIDKDYNGFNAAAYNVVKVFDGLTWADGVVADATNGANGGHGGWRSAGIGSRLRVTRVGDIIKVETSQPNSNEIYEPATKTINLASDPKLAMFRGAQSFGYVACSQPNATWAVSSRPSIDRPIIDVRTWTKLTKNGNDWTPVQTTKEALLADGTFYRNWSHTNETLGKFYFMDQQSNLYRM